MPFAQAKQTYFQKSYRGVGVEFNYKWLNYKGEEQAARFTLRQDDTNLGEREFKPFNNKHAQAYVYKQLQKKAKMMSTRNMEIKVKSKYNGYAFEAKGRGVTQNAMDTAISKLQKEQKVAMDAYIEKMMYQHVRGDENKIMPNYGLVSDRYVRMMAPVARALMKKVRRSNEREVANQVLSFLQTIPYDRLMNRYTSNGAGF